MILTGLQITDKNPLNQRNIGMIKNCDVLIAVYDGISTGGTANAVRDAIKMNKFIYYIDPKSI